MIQHCIRIPNETLSVPLYTFFIIDVVVNKLNTQINSYEEEEI
jgi:hypothetical protein